MHEQKPGNPTWRGINICSYLALAARHGGLALEELAAAVVGAGKMGLLHAGVFNSIPGCRLVAISEKDSMIRGALRQNLPRIAVYADFSEMLKRERLDLIAIATPAYLHRPMIEASLDAGLHVFVEKPLALNGRECVSLLRQKIKSKTMVGYCRRFLHTYELFKEIVDSGELGKLQYFYSQLFVGQVFRRAKAWQYERAKSGGGVLMDLGCHAIDMFHYLFGYLESVSAVAASVYLPDIEDYASLNISFRSGLQGSLQLSWAVRGYRLPELRIMGHFDHGAVTVTEKYLEAWSDIETPHLRKGESLLNKQQISKGLPIDIGGPEYTEEDMHFLDAIRNDQEPKCSFPEAAKTNFAIDAVYSSIRSGEPRTVEYSSRERSP